jgi:glycerophosphoryl diester phosphodiesterase
MIKTLGHRGVRHDRLMAENTLPALREGLTESDGIETDVELSRDKIAYLMHVSTIYRVPYIRSWVFRRFEGKLDPPARRMVRGQHFEDLASWEIDRLWLRDFSGIPRLSALFALAAEVDRRREKTINLELKSPYCAAPVVKAISRAEQEGHIARGQVIVSSFDHDVLAKTARRDPSLRTGAIFWQDSMRPCRLYPWIKDNNATAKPVSIRNLEDPALRAIMPDHFVLPVQGLKKIYADAVARLYPESSFIVWTPGREPLPEKNKALRRLLDEPAIRPHIHAVITNHPQRMKEFLSPL